MTQDILCAFRVAISISNSARIRCSSLQYHFLFDWKAKVFCVQVRVAKRTSSIEFIDKMTDVFPHQFLSGSGDLGQVDGLSGGAVLYLYLLDW